MMFLRRIAKMIRDVFLSLISNILYLVSLFIPKDRNIWIFGGWWGEKYLDNSKYMFEYINKHHKHIRAIWLTINRETLNLVRSRGYEAYLTYSLKGCWLAMRSRIAMLSHFRAIDFKPIPIIGRTKLVQLTHGIPLKKIGFDDRIFTCRSSLLDRVETIAATCICPYFRRGYDMAIATSEETRQRFSSAYNVPLDRTKITGFPRNDCLFSTEPVESDIGTSGVYMPTLRGELWSKFDLLERYGFDIEKVENFLAERNIRLYLKLHPANLPSSRLLEEIERSKYIILCEEDDIYGSLNRFSFLITDYSSVYFDYLLLDRPMIFTPFDLEDYVKKEREFYYKYDDVTPGPKAKDWDEVLKYIEESIADPDKYKPERDRVRKMFHKYCDGHSSERVYQEIIKLL